MKVATVFFLLALLNTTYAFPQVSQSSGSSTATTTTSTSSSTVASTTTSSATSNAVSTSTSTATSASSTSASSTSAASTSSTASTSTSSVSSTTTSSMGGGMMTTSSAPAPTATPYVFDPIKRVEVFPNANNSRVALDVRSANQSISYRTEFSMGVANVPRVGGQFFWRDNDTVPIFGIRVALLRIAEIGNGWSLTNSKNVIDFPNTTNLWSPITVTDVPNDKNVAFKKLSSTFSKAVNGSSTNVSVTLDSYFASEIVTVNGTIFVPNAIKYSLTIENFPFKFGNTTLAIAKGIIQKTGLGIQYDATARNVTLGNGRGGFNWVKNATYDSTITNVTADNALSTTFTLPIPKVNETEDDGDLENGETLNVVVFRTPIGGFTKFVWDPQVVLYEDQLLPNFPLNSTGNTTNQKNAATSASVTSMGVSMLALVAAWFIHFM